MYKKAAQILCLLTCLTSTSYGYSDYVQPYYRDGGQLLFKIKGLFYYMDSNKTSFTTTQGTASSSKNLFSAGYGAEGSVTYFITPFIAGELSAGVATYKPRSSQIGPIVATIGSATPGAFDNRDVITVPVSAIAQFHIAPYGGIRPYIGVGYSASFNDTKSRSFSIDSDSGLVLQAGVDFVSKSDNYISVEVKHYRLNPKITLEKTLLDSNGAIDAASKRVKLNPTTFTIGFGFRL